MREWPASTAVEMEALGARFGAHVGQVRLVNIHGPLGAGKTTFVRGLLRALGHEGAVKSPTFTLVEPYDLKDISVYHFDLYRLNDPQELEFIGLRDYLHGQGLCVVEWAERAQDLLPTPDMDIMISIPPNGTGRRVQMTARTAAGQAALEALA